jgi:putative ABC transport system substrate-binding protein
MRRRDFFTLLGGAAASWPLAARAQQTRKLPTIGFLGVGRPSERSHWIAAFQNRLGELGWIDGRTVAIEYRWTEGGSEPLAEFAAELVRRRVDIIVASATPPTVAAKQATSVIPIVFAGAGDPIGAGVVESLARPGGNATGLSLQQTDLAGKRIELLRDVVPGLRRLAIMANSDNASTVLDMREAQTAASTLGLEVVTSEIRRRDDIPPTLTAFKGRADALYICNDPLAVTNRVGISTLAASMHLPTVYGYRELVEAVGLMSYGPSFPDVYRRAAELVDKILRGVKPGEIPVEQPTKFDLVINLTTALALGLKVPDKVLALADEVIE